MKMVVGDAQGIRRFLGHFAEDADAEAGTRERVAVDHVARQAEFDADLAYLVLEQLAQRLDELHLHVLGQAADVVVALDQVRLAGLGAGTFDHVGIDRPLRQEVHFPLTASFLGGGGDLVRFLVEHFDEQPAR